MIYLAVTCTAHLLGTFGNFSCHEQLILVISTMSSEPMNERVCNIKISCAWFLKQGVNLRLVNP